LSCDEKSDSIGSIGVLFGAVNAKRACRWIAILDRKGSDGREHVLVRRKNIYQGVLLG